VLQFVATFCVSTGFSGSKPKTEFWVMHFVFSGTQPALPIPSMTLQEAKVRKLPFGICNDAYKNDTRVLHAFNSNKIICGGLVIGGVDTCLVRSIANFLTTLLTIDT